MPQPANVLPMPTNPEVENAESQTDIRAQRALRREQMRLWGGMPVTDVTVVIGMKDRNGARQEIVHSVDAGDNNFRISECNHSVKEELTPVRVDGKVEGFEPSGKYRLKLDCTYLKE